MWEVAIAVWRSRRIHLAEAAVLIQEPYRRSAMPSPQALFDWDSNSPRKEDHRELDQRKSDLPFRWDPGFGMIYLRLFYPRVLEIGGSISSIRIEDTDEAFWIEVRKAAFFLGCIIPELAGFVLCEATEASLAQLRDAVSEMAQRISREFPEATLREEAWQQVTINARLIPDEPKLDLIIRYVAMNDRKISRRLQDIEKHCGRMS